MAELEFPRRYEPLRRLGEGGGGEVWALRDKYTGHELALKTLSDGATEPQIRALIREAVVLSGLEGAGVPRVLRFGRLREGRPYLLRELALGRSLDGLIEAGELPLAASALVHAAEQLTRLHRAGVLHGDIKPHNIIVDDEGRATLVDLGLAAAWRDGGGALLGLTPRYAAPELLGGQPLTVRAEIYALGMALEDILEGPAEGATASCIISAENLSALRQVAARATDSRPPARYPSADEFASALRAALRLSLPSRVEGALLWPILGIEPTAEALLQRVQRLGPGELLVIEGAPGSGRSVLLRRLAWGLGVEGHQMAWLDESISQNEAAIEAELSEFPQGQYPESAPFILVDDAQILSERIRARLRALQQEGARLVWVTEPGLFEALQASQRFLVPSLDAHIAEELVKRAMPSLTGRLLAYVVSAAEGRPGALRGLIQTLALRPAVSQADIDRALAGALEPEAEWAGPLDERLVYWLDRGRYHLAAQLVEEILSSGSFENPKGKPVGGAPGEAGPHRGAGLSSREQLLLHVLRARLELGLGEAASALALLQAVAEVAEERPEEPTALLWRLYLARAELGLGNYERALELLSSLVSLENIIGAEALVFHGLGRGYLGNTEQALSSLTRAISLSEGLADARVQALAEASKGLVLQRADRLEEARVAYEACISAGEQSGDAGVLATAQLNIAGLLKMSGDIAGAIDHFEAALDMGRRSGRRSTIRQALLNLANTDLYLGRVARAEQSIAQLVEQREQLPAMLKAQLVGLEAELSAKKQLIERAVQLYEACAAAYSELGRGVDAAEARLEAALHAARAPKPNLEQLARLVRVAGEELEGGAAHQPLLLLAQSRLALVRGDDEGARQLALAALQASRDTGQREWAWKTLEFLAELAERAEQSMLAQRHRSEALEILEDISTRLPRDLREVYWNDARRAALRGQVRRELLGTSPTQLAPFPAKISLSGRGDRSKMSELSSTPLEQRLAHILEVNASLARERDLERLVPQIISHAIHISQAERGHLVLLEADGSLSVHTSRTRAGDKTHAEFSTSIARQVIESGVPLVSTSAREDARMRGYASVHQLNLQAVACVPILVPEGEAIGALYLETRQGSGRHFEAELPTLQAFGDQVAVAIESAKLHTENIRRQLELERANQQLLEAQGRLKELLELRSQRLRQVRTKLKAARETLYGHFGYMGLVGTSQAMRRVYNLIERVRDADVTVLITGESGTGKEVVARAIHNASARAKAPFLGVNCGAIPEQLLESELFGHVKGAFTGADRERKGLFREGEGGSILLDEIGEMPHRMQAGLLRVLQEHRVRAVGATHEEEVNTRVLCATHRNLSALVEQGLFREDLYYRIQVVEVRIPPLRERLEDIPQLVDHFLGLFSARYQRERRAISREGLSRLTSYHWPGNVRQLEHVLLNAWVLSEQSELGPEDFDLPELPSPSSRPSRDYYSSGNPGAPPLELANAEPPPSYEEHQAGERERILHALKACHWNRVRAAEQLGMPRRTFYRRLKQYGIQ